MIYFQFYKDIILPIVKNNTSGPQDVNTINFIKSKYKSIFSYINLKIKIKKTFAVHLWIFCSNFQNLCTISG